MKKALRILVTALALLAVLAVPVLAKGPKGASPGRPKGAPRGRPEGVSHGPPQWASASSPKGARRGSLDEGSKGPTGPAGKSNVAHLYLHEKTGDPDWDIVEGGAWGKMKYNLEGPTFDFVFNGHGLEPNTQYSLIYYADPWPGDNPGALIAEGTTNGGGNIHLAGPEDLGMDLPDPADENAPDGAKIWLVLSDDYDANNTKMIGWSPEEYLFEYDLITFDAD